MTIRVLHFYRTYWPDSFGGGERVIATIAQGAALHGIDTEILSLSRDPASSQPMHNGIRAEKVGYRFRPGGVEMSLKAIGKLQEMARSADIINYHYPYPFADMAHLGGRIGKPFVVTYHSDIVGRRTLDTAYSPLRNWFLSRANRILATSQNYADSSPVLARHADRTQIIPLGMFDRSGELDEAGIAHWRKRLPKRFLLFTGVFRYYKGLDYLLQATAKTGIDVVLVGGGPEEEKWKEKGRGINNLHFLGSLDDDDKYALLSLSDGFLFPSHLRSEAFGLSLVEAAMFGKPMISCEMGTGTSFVNKNEETGIVIPPADVEALAAAMQCLFDDQALAAKYGKAARKRYEDLFTADRMAASYADLYHEIMSSSRNGPRISIS